MSDDVRLILGDCLDVLRDMPDGSVDAVVTDPPYGIEIAEWDATIPYELLSEMLRVSTGAVIWFGAASKMSEQCSQFSPRPDRTLIWAPSFTLSHTRANGIYYRWHPIYVWRLPAKVTGPKWDVLTVPTECGNWWKHKCTKPVNLMAALLDITPEGATVLDPFMGSGTTGVACVQTGRRFIGVEINEGYYAIAEKRIAEARAQLRLPL